MRRLNLFAKGNVDVHDSLLYSRVAGTIQWNGINEALRSASLDVNIRVRHETWTRSDALLSAEGSVPESLRARPVPLGAYPAESQFSRAVFTAPCDVVVLSIQPDIMTPLYRHRQDGYLIYPDQLHAWPLPEKQWFDQHFTATGFLDVAASMDHLSRICQAIWAERSVPILVYNMSAVVPGEQIHSYEGLGETLATRIRRFNLALIEQSSRLGFSIVDVDTLIARAGADRLKLGPLHMTAEGYRLIAAEAVRILCDLGCLDRELPCS